LKFLYNLNNYALKEIKMVIFWIIDIAKFGTLLEFLVFLNFVPVELLHIAFPKTVSTITECVTRCLACDGGWVGGRDEQDKISVGCLLHHSQQPRRNFEISAATLYHRCIQLLGSFRKIAKSDFCLHLVSPSVLPRGKLGSH
jgi:hypothetical protein